MEGDYQIIPFYPENRPCKNCMIEYNDKKKLFLKLYKTDNNNIYQKYEKEKNNLKNLLDSVAYNNNNIVKIYPDKIINFKNGENYEYFVCEYLSQKRRLDSFFPSSQNTDEKYLRIIAINILRPIKKCHVIGITHNMIKPKNIILNKDFIPCLIHFSETIDKNYFYKDFNDLGNILIKLISGKEIEYKINKKKKDKKNRNEFNSEKDLWKTLKNEGTIPTELFKNYVIKLLKADKKVNEDDLFNDEWLKINEGDEKDYKEYCKKQYENIIENQNKDEDDIIDLNKHLTQNSGNLNVFANDNDSTQNEDNSNSGDIEYSRGVLDDDYLNKEIIEIDYKLNRACNDFIEIKYNSSLDSKKKKKNMKVFMHNLKRKVYNIIGDEVGDIKDGKYTEFFIEIKPKNNEEYEDENNENDLNKENENENENSDEEESESEDISINIQLLLYKNDEENDSEKIYYLLFINNEVDQYDYMNYFTKIKTLAKELLKNI